MVLRLLNSSCSAKDENYRKYYDCITEQEFAEFILVLNRLSEEISNMLGSKRK